MNPRMVVLSLIVYKKDDLSPVLFPQTTDNFDLRPNVTASSLEIPNSYDPPSFTESDLLNR
jgi:hypothetical protein